MGLAEEAEQLLASVKGCSPRMRGCGGVLSGWTFLTTSDRHYLNRQRRGHLAYSDGEQAQ